MRLSIDPVNMTLTIDALIDGNVIIAALAGDHEHHASSADLFDAGRGHVLGVAAHSYAEVYSTLTRRGTHAPFRFTAEEAWAALESVRTVTHLIGLTPAQTFDTVRSYAADGGIGARLYDRMIGQTAVVHGVPTIVTWNIGHMRGLFPTLDVRTPRDFPRA
ncbi:PIN domain-containing protein [Sphingobium sp. 22B]|uniref:type II toxin-antitoxin system VapC family toxin n=1 Tax=Sphingobium sp. 22B TaxID=936474 RepID=UPI001379C023|nr:PIN domain-containing protein [Sphingobium sp. 22B]